MATKPDRWYFSREQLRNSASSKCGVEPEKELSYRQQAANLIQDMGQRLQVFQLCINTAIVYMHRFYMFHSFTKFPRNSIAAATLFLAAKVEEQPHKLEHVIRVAHACLHRGEPPLDPRSNAYAQQAQELVINESIILQTLGFEVGVVHPHTHVVKCTQMIRASKDLSQSSYFLATNSLHLTTFSLKYKPTVVACVCIHLACKWTQWTIPKSNDGKGWWEYVDPSVTEEHLDELTREFLHIIDKCPNRLKKRIMGYQKLAAGKDPKRSKGDGQSDSSQQQASGSSKTDGKASTSSSSAMYDFSSFESKPASGFDQYSDSEDSKTEESSSQKSEKPSKDKAPAAATATSVSTPEQPRKPETVKVSYEEYKRKERERKEKEMLAKRQQQPSVPRVDKANVAGLVSGRSVSKESLLHGHKGLPSVAIDKNAGGVKERVLPQGLEGISPGQDRVHPSHERLHTGHDRIPQIHDKHAANRDKLPGSKRTVPGNDKIHTGHTRGPSGPERLSSGLEKPPSSSQGRDPASYSRPLGPDKIPSSLGSKSQEKVPPLTAVDFAKNPSVKQKELKRPELHPASLGSSKDGPVPTERTLPREAPHKEHGQRSYAQAVKMTENVVKEPSKHRPELSRSRHSGKSVKPTHSHSASEPPPPPPPPHTRVPLMDSLHAVKQRESLTETVATQETLAMFNQITAEIEKDLVNESLSTSPFSSLTNPLPTNAKADQRKPEEPILKDKLQMISPLPSPVGPSDAALEKLEPGELVDEKPAEVEASFETVREHRKEGNESRKERRREGHKSKKDDKKHKSHKHRHRSHSPTHKHGYENDVGEGSGDMAPAKKQRLEQTGSPHTVLNTSKGIKLKIKGLSNSFNNGSDHSCARDAEKTANASSDSPGSLSLKLNLSRLGSPHESSKEKEGSNHHQRSHPKHKSRHHRNKDGHHKRRHSPGLSSASDASPAISPSKRRPVEETKSGYHSSSQSLLDLPMPPGPVKLSSRHASPSVKHGKRKRESNPSLPDNVPPPPPPSDYPVLTTVTGLPPMQYSTIDASALYDFQPPLPNEISRDRRPLPPQKRPPLPH